MPPALAAACLKEAFQKWSINTTMVEPLTCTAPSMSISKEVSMGGLCLCYGNCFKEIKSEGEANLENVDNISLEMLFSVE